MGRKKKESIFYRFYVFLFFSGVFFLGGVYTNCATVEPEVRQKVFIDNVENVYPSRVCTTDEDGESDCSDTAADLHGLEQQTIPYAQD